jgi:hypothetical protein
MVRQSAGDRRPGKPRESCDLTLGGCWVFRSHEREGSGSSKAVSSAGPEILQQVHPTSKQTFCKWAKACGYFWLSAIWSGWQQDPEESPPSPLSLKRNKRAKGFLNMELSRG